VPASADPCASYTCVTAVLLLQMRERVEGLNDRMLVRSIARGGMKVCMHTLTTLLTMQCNAAYSAVLEFEHSAVQCCCASLQEQHAMPDKLCTEVCCSALFVYRHHLNCVIY
jgi:hypothetical protein